MECPEVACAVKKKSKMLILAIDVITNRATAPMHIIYCIIFFSLLGYDCVILWYENSFYIKINIVWSKNNCAHVIGQAKWLVQIFFSKYQARQPLPSGTLALN